MLILKREIFRLGSAPRLWTRSFNVEKKNSATRHYPEKVKSSYRSLFARSIFMLSLHLHLGLRNVRFPSTCQTELLCELVPLHPPGCFSYHPIYTTYLLALLLSHFSQLY